MKLELKNCTVRAFHGSDAQSLADQANDRAVWLQLRDAIPFPYTLSDARAFIEHATSKETATDFAIDVDGRAIGRIGLTLQADINQGTAEFGYWIGREHWGRGIATESLKAVSRWAMARFALRRVFAVPFSDNHASCHVLEKAGFTK